MPRKGMKGMIRLFYRIKLFLGIAWRDKGERISIKTAWKVAGIIHGKIN